MRLPLRLLLAALLLAPMACSSFRAAWTGVFNDDLAGDPAPALAGAAWVDDQGIDDTPREFTVEPKTVVAFFLPG